MPKFYTHPRFKEILFSLALTIGSISALFHLKSVPFIRGNIVFLTAAILLYLPIAIYWKNREPILFIDRSLSDLRRSFFTFLALALVVFPLLALANHFYQTLLLSLHFRGLPPLAQFASFFVRNLLFVALPEEFFYRGYLNDRLDGFFKKHTSLLGARITWKWPLLALLFALSHSMITIQWWHIFIFFPGLAFGWLREKTGTILAPILFHASSNTFAYWVFLSYSR